MTSSIDCVYNKCQKIKEQTVLILQQTFMMNIFSKLYKNLPELGEYLNWYQGDRMNWVHACNKNESRMCGVEQVIRELFYSKEAEN